VSELRVPKRRVEVEVAFTDGERRRLALFLAGSAAERAGPERVSDALCGDARFLPALDADGGDLHLLARAAISFVRLAAAEEPGDAEELTIPTEHALEVVLRDGARLAGTVSYVLPPERSRPIDFLNEAPAFFRLFTAPGEVLLVNREQVSRAVLRAR
jgi:hypothetical protein